MQNIIKNIKPTLRNSGRKLNFSSQGPEDGVKNYAIIKSGESTFVFDIETEERLELSADITQHLVEDGSYMSDHIAIKPNVLKISGFIGEIVQPIGNKISNSTNSINEKLSSVDLVAPKTTQGIKQKFNSLATKTTNFISAIDTKTSAGLSILESLNIIPKNSGFTSQQKAYANLVTLFKGRVEIQYQTVWNLFTMMIKSVTLVSNKKETSESTDILITLQEMQTVKLEITALDPNDFHSFAKGDSSQVVNKGLVKSEKSKSSTLFKASQKGGNIVKTLLKNLGI